MIRALLFSALLLASCLVAGEAAAEKRIALVIGNSNYSNVRPLPNPANDATAVADMFRAAHFDVVDASNNLGGLEMRRVFRDFAEKSRTADIAVVFYAGHGIEIDGTNYLLPVDASLKRDLDVEDEAISIDRVVRTLEPAKRLRLIILDACRDNPFVRTVRRTSETRSIGRGLAKIEPPSSDTLIAFAAKAGSTASDGNGTHSPFTVGLLKNLTTPGLDLRIALGRVRDDVMAATNNAQEPFVYGSLGGTTVTLVPEDKVAPTASSAPTAADMRRDYELASQVGTKDAWDSFLSLYPKGFYSDLARGQRSKLIAEETRVAAARAASQPPAAPAPTKGLIATPPAAGRPPDAKAADKQPAEIKSADVLPAEAKPVDAKPVDPKPVEAKPVDTPAPPKPQGTVTALATPAATDTKPEPPKIENDIAETTRQLHTELQRLGCYPGAVDASWGRDSRRALEQFNRYAKTSLDTKVASLDALGVVRGKTARVCPLECKTGYRADGDACVRIVCKSGYTVNDDGECERDRSKSRSASRPSQRDAAGGGGAAAGGAAAAPRRAAGGAQPAQVVCGMNGCLNVGKGCRSELRSAGRGEVAVVLCDK